MFTPLYKFHFRRIGGFLRPCQERPGQAAMYSGIVHIMKQIYTFFYPHEYEEVSLAFMYLRVDPL